MTTNIQKVGTEKICVLRRRNSMRIWAEILSASIVSFWKDEEGGDLEILRGKTTRKLSNPILLESQLVLANVASFWHCPIQKQAIFQKHRLLECAVRPTTKSKCGFRGKCTCPTHTHLAIGIRPIQKGGGGSHWCLLKTSLSDLGRRRRRSFSGFGTLIQCFPPNPSRFHFAWEGMWSPPCCHLWEHCMLIPWNKSW